MPLWCFLLFLPDNQKASPKKGMTSFKKCKEHFGELFPGFNPSQIH